MSDDSPSGHTYLDFNAPLSDEHARELVQSLQPVAGACVVDFGCGWAELLLRVLAVEPAARAIGIDVDAAAIARGRANARARGLHDRVQLEEADLASWAGEMADVAIAIGVSHAWNGAGAALDALKARVKPGGRLLYGDGIWEQPPTAGALAALEAAPGDFGTLADLVDLAIERGFRVLSVSVASLAEWDSFESRWCAGRERWLLEHPDAPDAGAVRAFVDDHRDGWLRGYRKILGFAYLTLATGER